MKTHRRFVCFHKRLRAFTLLEILVSSALLALLLATVASIVDSTSKTWRTSTDKVSQFRAARLAFESITRRLSQATLNTYWDYAYKTDGTPIRYERRSELRFVSGPATILLGAGPYTTHCTFFQIPAGVSSDASLRELINTWGYFIRFGDDSTLRPAILNSLDPPPPFKKRFRLMEFIQPAEKLSIFKHTSGNTAYSGMDWYRDQLATANPPVHVVAENAIALILLPRLAAGEVNPDTNTPYPAEALAPKYLYDTTTSSSDPSLNPKNQLPPVIQVTLVAISEESAQRMTDSDANSLQTKLSVLFKNADNFEADLNGLQAYLAAREITYRIFTANVSLRGAKWSREQSN